MSSWISKKSTQIYLRTTIKFNDIGNDSFLFELEKFDEKLAETTIQSFTFDQKEVLIISHFQFELDYFGNILISEIKYQWIRKEDLIFYFQKLTHLSKLESKFITISRILPNTCSLFQK